MLRSDSPLYLAPAAVLRLAPWLFRFWPKCNAADHARGLAATAAFNRASQAAFDRLESDGVAFELYRDGLLFVHRDRRQLEHSLADQAPYREYGYAAPELLSAAEVLRGEPALSDTSPS